MGHYDDFYEFYKDKPVLTLNDNYLPKPINFKKKIARVQPKVEPLTNDEWRRTCSAEEFAEWLFHYSFDKCNLCGHCWDENICPQCERHSDKDFFEKWLKEKYDEM